MKTKKPVYFLLFLLSGILYPGLLKSQSSILLEARADNFFAYPGNFQYLDVLKNDDYGACSQATVNLTVSSMSTPKGTAVVIPTTNRIYYMPNPGVTSGQDVFTYTIECGGNTSTATVYVNICEQPVFMEIDKCFVPRPATIWDIEKKAQSDTKVHPLATPFVGDLDGDGIPEIVVPNYMAANQTSYSNGSDTILILDNNLKLKTKFHTPIMPTYLTMPLLIADVDNDGQGEIVVFTGYNDGGADMYRLICYTMSGIRKWTSEVPVFTTDQRNNQTGSTDAGICLVIADMNGDGYPEILAYDKIFAAESGKLLVELSAGGRSRGSVAGNATYMPALADLDNDGMLEVAAGNTTYKVEITNRDGTAGNSASVLAQVNLEDGFTSIADINGDGSLDVVVTARNPVRLYVWDGRTSAMIGSVQSPGPTSNVVSRAFIGDITGNGVPDIAFTYPNGMVAYGYNRATDTFSQLWQKPTTDGSGCTTMSMFDFDQNGEAELIYRDETHLRIIDKDGNNIVEIDCHSGTHSEYPVIVDLDGDGHADILVSGANQADERSGNTYLMHYGSITPNQWANCRQVWNQHGFNPVYIREDLSLVRFPVNPATAFYEAQTGIVNYPYNNFLQQSTKLNQEGTPLHDGPNLYFDSSRQSVLEVDTSDNLKITIYIHNDGDASYTGNLRISTYVYDTSVNPALEYKIYVHNETVDIPPLSSANPGPTVISYTITNFSLVEPSQYDRWEIRLNWEDNVYPIDMEECRYSDNIDNNLALAGGERVMCEGETERVYAYPENTYWYIWYDQVTGGNRLGEGDFCDLSKDANPVQYYYLEIYDLATKSNRLSSVREPVSLYLAPDSLIWTGVGNNGNWHDASNWKNPVPLHLYDGANIPRACTNVLLPEHIDNYPDLATGKTIYTTYEEAACNNITFAHGGELVRQDLLDYRRAYVELELESNRWYMVAAPLEHLYPGDYYVSNPNPHMDDVFVYTRLFSRGNPQTGYYVSGDWTGAFQTPNFLLTGGLGFSVWIDDKQDDVTVHTPFTFTFPKYDLKYYLHDWEGNVVGQYSFVRTNHHRFIYESSISSGVIPLTAGASLSGETVIVGNPFLAQLDFDAFYDYNASWIEPYYQVMNADGVIESYHKGLPGSVGGPDRYIAPMQSVFITSASAFGNLYATPLMTASSPGNKLRGGNPILPEQVSVKLERENQSNRTTLLYHPQGEIGEEYRNVPQAFVDAITEPASVYFMNEKEEFLDIYHLPDLSQPVWLGVRTASTGRMEFRFEGLRDFASGYDIFLTDLAGEVPTQTDLRVFPYYRFEKEDDELFLNNRFYLSFVHQVTSVPEELKTGNQGIEIIKTKEGVKIVSVDGSLLKDVLVCDLQGRNIMQQKNVNALINELYIPVRGIFLVKASSDTTTRTMKFYN